ncbi:carboxymuconolactone decarboxylase family protein [Nitriliruptor alkaliphilus]|uniref:carboxymuconolactone decarboxylase family protein n=1 Tax=Nitriliruptor alkaliphilus TaxID=427918 RepID=UPI000698C9AE|nr:carboxymuconolactone decarboxylase family protein [Nitriliruptor alkaliphilus]
MARIPVPTDLPGIIGLFAARPDTAGPLRELAETLLRRDDGLGRDERELLATAVSARNDCGFCRDSHAAVAAAHLGDDDALADAARQGRLADVAPPRLAALTRLAEAVADGGRIAEDLFTAARDAGAGDDQLHDTVLIAAAFAMFNRYVDGLAADPADQDAYAAMGRQLATHGYRAAP